MTHVNDSLTFFVCLLFSSTTIFDCRWRLVLYARILAQIAGSYVTSEAVSYLVGDLVWLLTLLRRGVEAMVSVCGRICSSCFDSFPSLPLLPALTHTLSLLLSALSLSLCLSVSFSLLCLKVNRALFSPYMCSLHWPTGFLFFSSNRRTILLRGE